MLSPTATPMRFRRIGVVLIAALAAFPVIGNLVSAEFDWGAGDFAVWAVMVGVLAALLLWLVPRMVRTSTGLSLALIAGVLAFLLVWAELAVGIFD